MANKTQNPKKLVSLTLDEKTIQNGKKIGKGNLSHGVRKAVAMWADYFYDNDEIKSKKLLTKNIE